MLTLTMISLQSLVAVRDCDRHLIARAGLLVRRQGRERRHRQGKKLPRVTQDEHNLPEQEKGVRSIVGEEHPLREERPRWSELLHPALRDPG